MTYASSHPRWACALVSALLLPGVSSRAEPDVAPQKVVPITVPAKTRLEKGFLEQHRAWAKRVLVDPLAERSKAQPWSAAAVTFAEKAMQDMAVQYRGEELTAVTDEGKKLIASACKDPLVVYLTTRIEFRARQDPQAASKTFEDLVKQIEPDRAYSRALLVFVGRDLAAVSALATRSVSKTAQKTSSWLQAALEDGSYTTEDAPVFLRHQLAGQWSNPPGRDLAGLAKAAEAKVLPEWARRTLAGFAEIQFAWEARGGGYANTVTEEGWKAFGEHLAKARTELTEAWKLAPDHPEAATKMIEVVVGGAPGPNEEERMWFDRAIAAQFDYLPAYAAMLRAYRRRWGGSHELMLNFGRACRDTRRYDTEVPGQFFQAAYDVEPSPLRSTRRELFEAVPGLAREITDLAAALADEPTRKSERNDWLSFAAVQSWLGRNYETSAKYLKELNGKLTPKVNGELAAYGTTARELALDVEMHAGKLGDEVERADSLLQKHDLQSAKTAFTKLKQQASELTRPLIGSRLELIDFETAFATGEWVKVTPKPGLFAWTVKEGEWEAEADGTLVSHGVKSRGLILYRGRVGPNYELRGEFEVESHDNADRSFGVATGYRSADAVGIEFRTYQAGNRHPIAMVFPLKGGLPGRPKQTPIDFAAKNQFLLRIKDGETTFDLNGQTVFPADKAPPQMVEFDDSNFGFGGAMLRTGNVTRIRNIEIRRLP